MQPWSEKVKRAFDRQKNLKWQRRPELLLSPLIPQPMFGMAPRVVLGAAWWRVERKAAFMRTQQHCAACGVHREHAIWRKWLEGHEVYKIDYGRGRMTYLETVALCHFCHCYIHIGRLKSMLEQSKEGVTERKFQLVVQHGDYILQRAGLVRPAAYEGPVAEWADWRLVIGKQEFPPKYGSMEEWQIHYERQKSDISADDSRVGSVSRQNRERADHRRRTGRKRKG